MENSKLSREQLRAIIFYEYSCNVSAAQCYRNMCQRLGEGAVHRNTVENWYRKFQKGVKTLDDEPICGRPTAVSDEDLLKALEENPKLTTRELGRKFGVAHGTIANSLKRLNRPQSQSPCPASSQSAGQQKSSVNLSKSRVSSTQCSTKKTSTANKSTTV